MDYMRQLNGFWTWRMTHPLTHVQADLYFALLSCANAARWRSPLSVPNSTLTGLCQISKTELHRQRITLVENGLIEYYNGHKGVAGKYVIAPLYAINQGTNAGNNPGTNPGTHHGNIYKKKTHTNTNTVQGERNASYTLEDMEAILNLPIFPEEVRDGEN